MLAVTDDRLLSIEDFETIIDKMWRQIKTVLTRLGFLENQEMFA